MYRAGGFAALRERLNAGGDPNATSDTGLSLLAMGVLARDIDAVRLLLDTGARINDPCSMGGTALTWATNLKHEPIIELLLQRGANPECKSTMHEAYKQKGIDGLRGELASGADFNAMDEFGHSILGAVAMKGDVDSIRALIEAGADIEFGGREQMTPLILAANNGRERASKLLLELGANVHAKSASGYTALSRVPRQYWSLERFLKKATEDAR